MADKKELKEFTVGSVAPAGTGKHKKAPAEPKVEISEKAFPVLTGLVKGNGLNEFKAEASRVLAAAKEKASADGEKVQKAYAMALMIVDNGKVVK